MYACIYIDDNNLKISKLLNCIKKECILFNNKECWKYRENVTFIGYILIWFLGGI